MTMSRASDRARRRQAARLISATKALEARYVRALRRVVLQVTEAYNKQIEPQLSVLGRSDATKVTLGSSIELAIARTVGTLFDRHAKAVDDANRKGLALLGIRAPKDPRVASEIAKRRQENIDLVVNAGRTYAGAVQEIVNDPSTFGLRVEEIKAKLRERSDVTESRAELIARDQTLKLNGALTEIRQRSAGVDEYVWSTSLDERVRDSHAVLEGQRFSWSSPPEVGHPGQDFQCRCVALPVVAELEDL